MSYLPLDELKTAIYEYQMDEITEGDDTIALAAIEAAIDEVKSYLTPNNQAGWEDGRRLYDVTKIFAATGTNRNALILAHVKTIAKWWIILLANPDVIYEQVKERYDRSIDYLTKIAKGQVTIPTLPTYVPAPTDEYGNPVALPEIAIYGSRRKFNHEDSSGYYDNPFYSQTEPA